MGSDQIIRRPDGERYDYISLATASDEILEEVLRAGTRPAAADLAGWEFRGTHVPELLRVVGLRKFKKGFVQDGQQLRGYSVKVRQNRLGEAWIDVMRGGVPVRHGWCQALPAPDGGPDGLYPEALLLDYGAGRNHPLDPARVLRDYLVQVYPDNPDLLLGKAYAALGGRRTPLSFFVLERYNPAAP